MSISQRLYRDRIYIVMLKLVEYGQLNPTSLISFYGLNFKKHISIINKMESKGLIIKDHVSIVKDNVLPYRNRYEMEYTSTISLGLGHTLWQYFCLILLS
jgi:hypothetical protein